MLREVVLPALVPLLLFVAVVLLWLRRPVPRPEFGGRPAPVDLGLIGHVARTSVGGYAAFLVIFLAFEFGVGGERLADAVAGGLGLAVVSAGAFLVLSWLESRVRSRPW